MIICNVIEHYVDFKQSGEMTTILPHTGKEAIRSPAQSDAGKIVVKASMIAGRHIWLSSEIGFALTVSNELRLVISEQKILGFEFIEISEA